MMIKSSQDNQLAIYLRHSLVVIISTTMMFLSTGTAWSQSMSEFEQWKRQYMGEFKQFKDDMDREFADFLNQRWKAFETEKGKVRDEKPKPVNIPVAKIKPPVSPAPPAVKPKPIKTTPQPIVKPEPIRQPPPAIVKPEAIKRPGDAIVKPQAIKRPPDPIVIPEPIKRPVEPIARPAPTIKPPAKPEPVISRIPAPAKPVEPVSPIPMVLPESPSERVVKVSFLGYQFTIIDSLSTSTGALSNQVSQKTIQQDFTKLAQSDYKKTLDQLLKIKQQLSLNDWAYVQLIQTFSDKLVYSSNSKTLIKWFLMLKSGLDARVAYSKREIFLLVAVKQNLYDIAYFTFGGQKYYSVTKQSKLPNNLYSYDGHYPKKLNLSDFSLAAGVNSREDVRNKQLRFSYGGQQYVLDVPYNRNTVDFLATYPQMDIDQYFGLPVDRQTNQALLSQLKPIVANMPQQEAVNLLLRFVQKAFQYETDQQQFGQENYMFIEETLYYPASDCEDRSIFFSWLVKNLLDIDVVGLDFPGHVATAVLLDQPVGDTVVYQGKRYTIADPTYINANAGMKMPQYKSVTPKVIVKL